MRNGSSPHAWGTRRHRRTRPAVCRFIPTRMGNTTRTRARIGVPPVHPHTHGEHGWERIGGSDRDGSSPHAWGTRRTAASVGIYQRFIPTRMGNTFCELVFEHRESVHPHTHGEHYCLVFSVCYRYGSSPHAWGTHFDRRLQRIYCRFIPTRMGNTATQPPTTTS